MSGRRSSYLPRLAQKVGLVWIAVTKHFYCNLVANIVTMTETYGAVHTFVLCMSPIHRSACSPMMWLPTSTTLRLRSYKQLFSTRPKHEISQPESHGRVFLQEVGSLMCGPGISSLAQRLQETPSGQQAKVEL
jgi:hypothetical protein